MKELLKGMYYLTIGVIKFLIIVGIFMIGGLVALGKHEPKKIDPK